MLCRCNVKLVIVAAVVVWVSSLSASDASDHKNRLDRDMRSVVELLDVPGLAVAVVHDGQPVSKQSYGFADLAAKRPMTEDTLVEIASVTKTMTSVIVGQLIDEGAISLDDRVVQYPFTNWFQASRITPEVRLRHVLSHTSQGELGRTYLYQGNRFNFVWGVFGSATKDSFQDSLTTRILSPLGMKDTFPQTGLEFTDEHQSRVAVPYRYEKDSGPLAVESPPSPEKNQVVPAAGLFSTLNDLVRYSVALQRGKLLKPEIRRQLEQPLKTNAGNDLPYAIGWAVQQYQGERFVWHYGYGNGNSALLLRVPDRKLTFILLSNSGNVSGSTRWGYGDLLASPFVTSFLRHYVFEAADNETGALATDASAIVERIAALPSGAERDLLLREWFAKATVLSLMEGRRRNLPAATEILVALDKKASEFLRTRGLTALDVLGEINDPRLVAAHEAICETLLQSHPAHPIVLLRAAEFHLRQGEKPRAIELLTTAADSKHFEDEVYTVDACLQLGELLRETEPDRARDYLWRAVVVASRIPADLSAKQRRAIDSLGQIDPR